MNVLNNEGWVLRKGLFQLNFMVFKRRTKNAYFILD